MKKDWLIVSIITLIAIISWLIFDIMHKSSQVDIPVEIKNVLDPINPNFDIKALENIP